MREQHVGGVRTESWQRHDLLHVAPHAWTAALVAYSLGDVPFLAQWADRGWPVIVRRRLESDGSDVVPVGVPLPPAAGKLRFALKIPQTAVTVRAPPTSLRIVAAKAELGWQPTIAGLIALGEQHGIEPAAFGSLLWEHHTGLTYLSPTSDLDVIWRAQAGCNVANLLRGIAQIERVAPMRIDGELIFQDGAANWRELYKALGEDGPAEILVKTMDGVRAINVRCLPGCERVQ
jgi:phosphoribosyl-dephospho-CoA transferase